MATTKTETTPTTTPDPAFAKALAELVLDHVRVVTRSGAIPVSLENSYLTQNGQENRAFPARFADIALARLIADGLIDIVPCGARLSLMIRLRLPE